MNFSNDLDEIKNEKVRNALGTILSMFEEENLPIVARAVFKAKNGKPSDRWSFSNRFIMLVMGTNDARTFNQWKEVNRFVLRGSSAFYILAPMIRKIPAEVIENDVRVTRMVDKIKGFKALPVFRFEDTDGEPVIEDKFQFDIPCQFEPLITELDLKIYTTAFKGDGYGSFCPSHNMIMLATPEIKTFLHEISHAVDNFFEPLKGGQHSHQEIIAEMSACILGYLMGYMIPMGNSKHYIEGYGSYKDLLKCLTRIEKVVNFVIEKTSVQPSFFTCSNN